MNVKGQAVIVTGGASGLGGATASALAAAGAKVAVARFSTWFTVNGGVPFGEEGAVL